MAGLISLRIGLGFALFAGSARADFASDAHTVALWKFDRRQGLSIPDDGPDSLDLQGLATFALAASPEDSALVLDGSTRFSLPHTPKTSVGLTGQLTYQARIRLDEYPSASLHNQYAFLMGKYEGMGLFIRSDGRLSVNNQMGDGSSWMWYAPVTARGAVPLKRWVEVAAACDQGSSTCYVYVDGKAQATYTYMVGEWFQPMPALPGEQFRSAASPLTLGYNQQDNQGFQGQVEAIRISDTLVLGPGPAPITTEGTPTTHFGILPSTVALWTFDSYWLSGSVPNFADDKRFTLQSNSPPLEASPSGRAARCEGAGCAFSTAGHGDLTVGGTGKLLLEARIWMDEYPSPLLHNRASVVAGMYEGLKLLIFADGRIQAAGQRLEGTSHAWYAPISRPGAVPLKRWVDVAVAADEGRKQMHAWVDGKAVQLYVPAPTDSYAIDGFRSPASAFYAGRDAVDGQGFKGRLEEVRVSDSLALGPGLDALSDPDIMKDTVVVKPTPVKVNLGIKTHHGRAGDTITVPVYLTHHDMVLLSACQFDLNLDTTVAALVSVSADSGLAKGWTLLDWNREAKSPVAIALAGADRPLAYGEGELLRLRIRILPGAQPGASTPLELTRIMLDENAALVPTHVPGRLLVAEPRGLLGDVTGNGVVDLFDAVRIQEAVVGRITLPDPGLPAFTLAVADVSGNGQITSYDAALVFQYALGLISRFPAEGGPSAKAAGTEAIFTVGPALAAEGGVHQYAVRGEGLAGMVAGEFAFAVADPSVSVAATTTLPWARLSQRYDAANRLLLVSLATNDPIAASALDLLVIEATPASGTSAPGLSLVSAYLNEGRIAGRDLPSQPLAAKAVPPAASRPIGWRLRGRELVLSGEIGKIHRVQIFDGRGRRLRDWTPVGNAGEAALSLAGIPVGVFWLRVVHDRGVTTGILPKVRP